MDLEKVLKLIDDTEYDERRPLTEELMQKIGSNINALVDVVDSQPSVGSIEASFLTEAEFQSIRGSGWVLCDGRDVTGSRYHELTGSTTIPDARGLYIRMATDEVYLRQYQADTIASHSHEVSWDAPSSAPRYVNRNVVFWKDYDTGGSIYGAYPVESADFTSTYSPNAGVEHSGPKHVVCNWFIRIN